MDVFQIYGKEIVALLIPFITWLLNAPQRHRPRLVFSVRHTFTFLVQEPLRDAQGNVIRPTQTVNVRSVIVQNLGKQAATNVEAVFNWRPLCINMWPSRHVEEKIEADKRYCVQLKSLAPGEFVGFEMYDINRDIPELITCRSDQCTGTQVQMVPQLVQPAWKVRLYVFLTFCGMAGAAYVVILAIQWLVLKTPS